MSQLFLVIVLWAGPMGSPEEIFFKQMRCEYEHEMVPCVRTHQELMQVVEAAELEEGIDYWVYFDDLDAGAYGQYYINMQGQVKQGLL